MSAALELHNFVPYRGTRALSQPLSFQLVRGHILLLKGTNGAGKTTVLRAILGMHTEWTGTMRLGTRDVSYLGQTEGCFDSMTLNELLPLVIGNNPARQQQVLSSLRLTLTESATSPPLVDQPLGIMSGGQYRRAQLAMALCRTHSLLLLDEPLSGVDAASRALIRDVIRDLTTDSAVMLVEHTLDGKYDWGRPVWEVSLATVHLSE